MILIIIGLLIYWGNWVIPLALRWHFYFCGIGLILMFIGMEIEIKLANGPKRLKQL